MFRFVILNENAELPLTTRALLVPAFLSTKNKQKCVSLSDQKLLRGCQTLRLCLIKWSTINSRKIRHSRCDNVKHSQSLQRINMSAELSNKYPMLCHVILYAIWERLTIRSVFDHKHRMDRGTNNELCRTKSKQSRDDHLNLTTGIIHRYILQLSS